MRDLSRQLMKNSAEIKEITPLDTRVRWLPERCIWSKTYLDYTALKFRKIIAVRNFLNMMDYSQKCIG
jgi:hypothetical protein